MKTSVRLRMGGLLAAAAVATGGLVAVDAGTAPAEAAVSCTISSPKTVRPGNTGSCVTLLQKVLGGLKPDGSFGSATTARVKNYQRAKGLADDGIVGSRTWSKIRAGMSGAGTLITSVSTANWYACLIVRGGSSIRYTVTNKRSTSWKQAYIYASSASGLIRGTIASKRFPLDRVEPLGLPEDVQHDGHVRHLHEGQLLHQRLLRLQLHRRDGLPLVPAPVRQDQPGLLVTGRLLK